jgi:hypothetical protein
LRLAVEFMFPTNRTILARTKPKIKFLIFTVPSCSDSPYPLFVIRDYGWTPAHLDR